MQPSATIHYSVNVIPQGGNFSSTWITDAAILRLQLIVLTIVEEIWCLFQNIRVLIASDCSIYTSATGYSILFNGLLMHWVIWFSHNKSNLLFLLAKSFGIKLIMAFNYYLRLSFCWVQPKRRDNTNIPQVVVEFYKLFCFVRGHAFADKLNIYLICIPKYRLCITRPDKITR